VQKKLQFFTKESRGAYNIYLLFAVSRQWFYTLLNVPSLTYLNNRVRPCSSISMWISETDGALELLTLLTTVCLSHTFVVEFSIWLRGFLSMQNMPEVPRILQQYNFHRECNSSMFRVSSSTTGKYRSWKRSAYSEYFSSYPLLSTYILCVCVYTIYIFCIYVFIYAWLHHPWNAKMCAQHIFTSNVICSIYL